MTKSLDNVNALTGHVTGERKLESEMIVMQTCE